MLDINPLSDGTVIKDNSVVIQQKLKIKILDFILKIKYYLK